MTQRVRDSSRVRRGTPRKDPRLARLGTRKAIFPFSFGLCGGLLATWMIAIQAVFPFMHGDLSPTAFVLLTLAPVALGVHQVWFWGSRDRRAWCFWIGWLVGSGGLNALALLHAFALVVLSAFR